MSRQPASGLDLGALSKLAPELAETFVALASDIALVLDPDGRIQSVAVSSAAPLGPTADEWIGRPWGDTVTGDTRAKVETLLSEVVATGFSRRSEVNHTSPNGDDIPISYAAIRLGRGGPLLAVGRDLRAIAAIQQQFVDAQQEIEREYWKQRQAESRYRMLFQVATDAVLVVDAESLRIVDVNAAASRMFDLATDQLVGLELSAAVDRGSRLALAELLAQARSTGLPGEIRVRLAGRRIEAWISATPFRTDDAMMLMVRARAADAHQGADDPRATLAELVERTPDGVVLSDTSGRMLTCNPAFVRLAGFADQEQARGRPLSELIGPEVATLLALARERGIASRRAATLRGVRGQVRRVEISAVLLAEEERACIGLTIHPVDEDADRAPADGEPGHRAALVAAVERITTQLGTLGLSELLAEVTRHAERHFVETALRRSHDDPAAAAALLGVTERNLAQLQRRLAGPREPKGTNGDGTGSPQRSP